MTVCPTLIVRMPHVRAADLCVLGARGWFAVHGLNFRDFCHNGIDAEILRATGDPMALRAIEQAEKEARNG